MAFIGFVFVCVRLGIRLHTGRSMASNKGFNFLVILPCIEWSREFSYIKEEEKRYFGG